MHVHSHVVSAVVALTVLVTSQPSYALFTKKPEKSEIHQAFQKIFQESRAKFKLSSPEILAKEQVGSKTNLRWEYRLEMMATTQEPLFAQESRFDGTEMYTPVIKKNTQFPVGGIIEASYRNGSWNYDIEYDSVEIQNIALEAVAESNVTDSNNILNADGGMQHVLAIATQVDQADETLHDLQYDLNKVQSRLDELKVQLSETKSQRRTALYAVDEAKSAAKAQWKADLKACADAKYQALQSSKTEYDMKVQAIRDAANKERTRVQRGCDDVLAKLSTARRDAERKRQTASLKKIMDTRSKVISECNNRKTEIDVDTQRQLDTVYDDRVSRYGNGLNSEQMCLKDPKRNDKWGELKNYIENDPIVQEQQQIYEDREAAAQKLSSEQKQLIGKRNATQRQIRKVSGERETAISKTNALNALISEAKEFMKSSEKTRGFTIPGMN